MLCNLLTVSRQCSWQLRWQICILPFPQSKKVISYLPGTQNTRPVNAKLKQHEVLELLTLQQSTTQMITPNPGLQSKCNIQPRLQKTIFSRETFWHWQKEYDLVHCMLQSISIVVLWYLAILINIFVLGFNYEGKGWKLQNKLGSFITWIQNGNLPKHFSYKGRFQDGICKAK